MFENKKVQEELGQLSGRVIETINDVRNLSVEVGKLRTAMNLQKDLQGKEEEFLTGFEENAKKMVGVREDFEKALYDFKLLSGDMEKKLTAKFDEVLKDELKGYVDGLKKELGDVAELKESISAVKNELGTVQEEVKKFTSISSNIKEADFELTQYIKKVNDMDAEKLELMRKIDSLERLLARMKRTG
tara:strand:+ start:1052 stop:1615 length:564 start_codon:yes stop_codon:yes gene_type:complete